MAVGERAFRPRPDPRAGGRCGLVEAVYGSDPDDWVPAALSGNVIKAIGEAQAARSVASSNLLSVAKGYGADHPGWDEDTRTPTRLGEEMTTLRLARVEDGRLEPWRPDPDPHCAWALSEVAVRKYRVPDVLTAGVEDDPIVAFDWPRADLDAGAREFLIGSLSTACWRQVVEGWEDWWAEPPGAAALDACFAPFRDAFLLDGPGPRSSRTRRSCTASGCRSERF